MIERRRGRILAITSEIGRTGMTRGAHYAASKAGIDALVKSLAKEVGDCGITVNAIAPGLTDTPMMRGANSPEYVESIVRTMPGARLGQPDDCVNLALFLLSDGGFRVTGQSHRPAPVIPARAPARSGHAMEPALTLHKLQVFREVVRCQSLTRAAEALYVSQPVVSAHVRDLEVYFGARLMYQQGRRMLPNEAGKAVYDYAVGVLRATEDARGIVRLLESAEAGSALIGSTETPGAYLLPERLVRFKLANPLAGITMDVASASEIWAQTFEGNLDFSIVAGPEPPSDLHSEVFSLEPLVLVCCSGHPLLGRHPTSRDDLRDEPFVSLGRRRAYDERLQELGVSDQSIVMRLGNVEGLKQAVIQEWASPSSSGVPWSRSSPEGLSRRCRFRGCPSPDRSTSSTAAESCSPRCSCASSTSSAPPQLRRRRTRGRRWRSAGDRWCRSTGAGCHGACDCRTRPAGRLAAVHHPVMARARAFADGYPAVRAYERFEDLLADPTVDVVLITTPNALHADQAVAAAHAGKHVFCDKPLALSVADAARVVVACREAGVRLGVNFQLRHVRSSIEIRTLVRSGAIGRVIASPGQSTPRSARSCSAGTPDPGSWSGRRQQPGGHTMDLVRFILGSEVSDAMAMLDVGSARKLERSALALLRFESGELVYVHADHRIRFGRNDCVVYGTEGTIVARNLARHGLSGDLRVVTPQGDVTTAYSTADAYVRSVADMNRAVESGTEPLATGLDGLRSVGTFMNAGMSWSRRASGGSGRVTW